MASTIHATATQHSAGKAQSPSNGKWLKTGSGSGTEPGQVQTDYYFGMTTDVPLFGIEALEPLARIMDRARSDNGIGAKVQREKLSTDLNCLFQDLPTIDEPIKHDASTPWDMVAEEMPSPTRRYKVFAKALAADDPLRTLRTLSQDRSPSEFYLLKIRINSFARSRRTTVEKSLADLQTAIWADLSSDQQATIHKHLSHLETFYYKTQKRNTDPMEHRINLAVHALADLFAFHTHFDRIPTDLPYAATSRFIQFLCLALRPIAHINKRSPDAVSMRWRRLRGTSGSDQD